MIAALDVEHQKRDLLEHVDAYLAATDETREQLAKRYRLPKRWERNLATLKALVEALPEPANWPV